MNKLIKVAIFLLCLSALIIAAQRPFPQNIKYPYGFIPKTLSSDWAKSEYDNWIKTALTTCSSDKIFITADGGYKVEAIGFAALIFAYMGDKTKFDATYNFYKANLTTQAGGMMGWIGSCSGPSDQGGATDGDVDVAFGLLIASWQWPDGGYLEKAKAVITVLKKMIDTTCSGNLYALRMGYNFGGCNKTDISYYNPAAFREFAKVVGNAHDSAMWVKLADDTYTILNAAANATTGLCPDQQTTSGSPSGNYGQDACRTPWRITLDYLWNGNEKAKEWCIKLSNFAYNFGIKKIQGGFSLSGSPVGGGHETKFVGGFAIAAMANSQSMVDEFGTDLKTIKDYHWFNLSLKACYLITLTGNQWRYDLPDSGKVALKQNDRRKSNGTLLWKIINSRQLSLGGLQPGQTIVLTHVSGKRLYRATAASDKASIDISSLKSGCVILIVSNKNRDILKTNIISTF